MSQPYVIAEMGVNFFDTAKSLKISLLDAAKMYIKEAASVGVDCAKFQSYKADTITSKNSPAYWDIKKEPTKTQYELFSKYDSFGEKEYQILCDCAHENGMDFTSTPFDYKSVDYLYELVDFYKISSSDISNLPFVEYIGKKGKPVYLSVGASYLAEIDNALRVLEKTKCEKIVLLHCVLSYPTLEDDANLKIIQTLKRTFPDIEVGYSDHVAPDQSMITLATAYLLGANIIEKHFTLDKTLLGNDHYHAGDPKDFKKAIDNFKLINSILGSGKKTVLECEKIPRREARRSLVTAKNISKGEIISVDSIMAKRPGTGISPEFLDIIIGRKASKDIKEDTVLTWDTLL